jgi:hypothetical protein
MTDDGASLKGLAAEVAACLPAIGLVVGSLETTAREAEVAMTDLCHRFGIVSRLIRCTATSESTADQTTILSMIDEVVQGLQFQDRMSQRIERVIKLLVSISEALACKIGMRADSGQVEWRTRAVNLAQSTIIDRGLSCVLTDIAKENITLF